MSRVGPAVAAYDRMASDYETLVEARVGFDESVKQDDAIDTAEQFATKESSETLKQASEVRIIG